MLRGAIDYVTPERVGGWIYAEYGSVQQRTVLAFVDDVCVGSGQIVKFRRDLAEVGLGDGILGFEFPIAASSQDASERVVVKLEGSDLLLIQAGNVILSPNSSCLRPASIDKTGRALEWMRVRGWLEQSEIDLIRSVSQTGAYDLSLVVPTMTGRGRNSELYDPEMKATACLSLLSLEPVPISGVTLEADRNFGSERSKLLKRFSEPVVALWTPAPGALLVVEGSQTERGLMHASNVEGAVEYQCGPDRLLFVDLRCRIAADGPFTHVSKVFGVSR